MLGVSKEATDSEIKKAYKKLALQLHPDKNKAPGAAEGFKAIGNAVATLTDAKKRKAYDLYGADEMNHLSSGGHTSFRHQHSEFAYARGFESDVTAEELFNIFFGTGFQQQPNIFMRQRRYRTEHTQQQQREVPFIFSFFFFFENNICLFLAIWLCCFDKSVANTSANNPVNDVIILYIGTNL